MRVYLPLFFFLIVLVGPVEGHAQPARLSKAKATRNHSSYLLTYRELMVLTPEKRTKYLKRIGKYLSILKERSSNKSLLHLVFPKAFASAQFRCIGGGVPVPGSQQNCGVSRYAGFSCPDDMEICNPLIFGLLPSGQPVCYANATTSKCYRNITTGHTTLFSDSRFQSAQVKSAYEQFQKDIDAICSGEASIQESQMQVAGACGLVRKQTQVNRTRNILLSGGHQVTLEAVENRELGAGEATDTDASVAAPSSAVTPSRQAHNPRNVTGFNEEQRLAMVQEVKSGGKASQAMTFIPGLGNVMNDALKLSDGTYVNVTMAEAREIARAWGCRLPNKEEASKIRLYAQEHGRVFRAQSKLPNNSAQRYTNAQWMMNNSEMRRRSEIGRTTFINGHFKWYIENGGGFSFYGFYAPPNCYGASSTGYCQNGGSGGHGYSYIDYSQSARFICPR